MKPLSDKVAILMATFNGERYLPEQLESIAHQTYRNWQLIVSDDGSDDGTLHVVRAFQDAHAAGTVQILAKRSGPRGAIGNFSYLLNEVDSFGYYLLSDQDDVWAEDKVVTLLSEIKRLEAVHGEATPILVHSDLSVVAADGSLLHPSMNRYQNLQREKRRELRNILVQNNVTGCSVIFNESLRAAAVPIPDSAQMHDWWLALVATALGVLEYVPQSFTAYRQHGSNVAGASKYSKRKVFAKLFSMSWSRDRNWLKPSTLQAEALVHQLGSAMDGPSQKMVLAYARLYKVGPIMRRVLLMRWGFWQPSILRNVRIFVYL